MSRPVIGRSLWNETKSHFLHGISYKALPYNIPDKLVINADQTTSTSIHVATDNIAMGVKGEKYISRTGSNDNRSITLRLQTMKESNNIKNQILEQSYLFSLFINKKGQGRYQMLIFLTVFPCQTMKNTGVIN